MPVNHKRAYRLMSQNSLLLARHTGRGRQISRDGKVITLRSNLRWCSDTFEIPRFTPTRSKSATASCPVN
ncbi:MAG: hypothetical protein H5U31_06900 [Marinobacter sp.]|jgi:hypothetical protein|nr:hypothetical protein [Marinobacter sp.]